MVTNQLQWLPRADHIIILGRDGSGGTVVDQGSYQQLAQRHDLTSLVERINKEAANATAGGVGAGTAAVAVGAANSSAASEVDGEHLTTAAASNSSSAAGGTGGVGLMSSNATAGTIAAEAVLSMGEVPGTGLECHEARDCLPKKHDHSDDEHGEDHDHADEATTMVGADGSAGAGTKAGDGEGRTSAAGKSGDDGVDMRSGTVKARSSGDGGAGAGAGGGEKGQLFEAEVREVGAVKADVFKAYLTSSPKVVRRIIFFSLFAVASQGASVLQQLFLAAWSSDPDYTRFPIQTYIGGLIGVSGILAAFSWLRALLTVSIQLEAGRAIHQRLSDTVLGATQSFCALKGQGG